MRGARTELVVDVFDVREDAADLDHDGLRVSLSNTEPSCELDATAGALRGRSTDADHAPMPWQTSTAASIRPRVAAAPRALRTPRVERTLDLRRRQRRHVDRDRACRRGRCRPSATMAGPAHDARVVDVDRVGDHGGRGIGLAPRWRASTVTLSAMPSEKLRPRQPLVAMPRTGMLGATVEAAVESRARAPASRAVEARQVGEQADAHRLRRARDAARCRRRC